MPRVYINRTSQDIIENWYKKSANTKNYFDKFISIWISFNCFYNAEFSSHNFKQDAQYISQIKSDTDFITVYNKLLKRKKFKKLIDDFVNLIAGFPQNGYIRNLKNPSNNPKLFDNSNKNDFSALLDIIYQVRCNLFHGNKNNDDPEHKETVTFAYKLMREYLRTLYKSFTYNI